MPLSVFLAEPDPGGQPGPGPAPAIPEIGTYDPVWIAPDGTVLPLNPPGNNFFTIKRIGGLGAVPVDLVTTPAPDGGTVVDYVRPRERTIQWPLRMRGETHMEFLALWRRVTELFTMTRQLGPGRLRLYRPDGSAREILALYQVGLEGQPDDGAWITDTATVGLYCPNPFWRAVEPVRREWRHEAQPDFVNPFPSFGSGQVLGAASIRNDGHDDAWPTWTVRGPLTSLTATNVTRNETFTLTYVLTAGQTLTMTTKPVRVRGPGGVQAINALNLTAGGIPWRVEARSVQDIQFTATGVSAETSVGADDGTMIAAEFVERFETC